MTVAITSMGLALFLTWNDFFIASGSEVATIIYRHPLWFQVFCSGATIIGLFVGLFIHAKVIGRKTLFLLASSFFVLFVLSTQTIVLSFRDNALEEFYGSIKFQSIYMNNDDAKLMTYSQNIFFTRYENEKSNSIIIVRWPLPGRHAVDRIIAEGYAFKAYAN